ncbi:hypothetical protein Nm8I071_63890 [Nonomuraea sp. TT08I-71]|nr:hypothetical protein Nm8I071_63890 [Nonomuraea sp. TT08I-71]
MSSPAPAGGSPGPDPTTPVPPSGRTPLSAGEPPAARPPTGPPRHPSDQRRRDMLAGRISRGGNGPCYGLVTDDGREYALYGTGLGAWPTGTWVRVTVGPPPDDVNCGPGILVGLVAISRVD